MRRTTILTSRSGTMLILVLWALSLLTIFAVNIGTRVRQKGQVALRLDQRARLAVIAQAGVFKAMAVLTAQVTPPVPPAEPLKPFEIKALRYNNPEDFGAIELEQGRAEVRYRFYDDSGMQTRYGVVDEERKININRADRAVLVRFFGRVLSVDDAAAGKLASAVIDWYQYGDSEIVGFYSDEYYDNLEFAYPEKKAPFEHPEELLLVRGITPEIYEKIRDFVTVYGDGRVNINTAGPVVLWALGFTDDFIARILNARRGPDGVDGTIDDMVLGSPQELSAIDGPGRVLSAEDTALVQTVSGLLGVESNYFRVESEAHLARSSATGKTAAVFHLPARKIVYWREY